MVADFAPFGSGAETFPKIYTLYRANPNLRWEAYAHDDYLEMRITFGWVGMGLILSALLLVPLCGHLSSGIPTGRTFHLLWITALGGLMLHARFDPFHLHYPVCGVVLPHAGEGVRRIEQGDLSREQGAGSATWQLRLQATDDGRRTTLCVLRVSVASLNG